MEKGGERHREGMKTPPFVREQKKTAGQTQFAFTQPS
jgi:hypothetical protein